MSTMGSRSESRRMPSAWPASAWSSGASAWAAGGVTPPSVPSRRRLRPGELQHVLAAGVTPVCDVVDGEREAPRRHDEVLEAVVVVVAVAVRLGRRDPLAARLVDRPPPIGPVRAPEEGGVE